MLWEASALQRSANYFQGCSKRIREEEAAPAQHSPCSGQQRGSAARTCGGSRPSSPAVPMLLLQLTHLGSQLLPPEEVTAGLEESINSHCSSAWKTENADWCGDSHVLVHILASRCHPGNGPSCRACSWVQWQTARLSTRSMVNSWARRVLWYSPCGVIGFVHISFHQRGCKRWKLWLHKMI